MEHRRIPPNLTGAFNASDAIQSQGVNIDSLISNDNSQLQPPAAPR